MKRNACQKCVFAVRDDNPHCGLRGFTTSFNVEWCESENDKTPNGYELQEDGYFSWVEKKKKYPKTYEECCEIVKEKVNDNKLLVMENKINIAEILKDCPKGTKLYSPLCGECRINSVEIRVPDKDTIIRVKFLTNEGIENYITFYYDGTYFESENGECLLFPSKENRDWNKFKTKKPKFDPKTLQPFDKVIVRNGRTKWKCGIFSHINDTKYPFNMECAGCNYTYCIPYNEETKHLIGTDDEAPEFYRYWEE